MLLFARRTNTATDTDTTPDHAASRATPRRSEALRLERRSRTVTRSEETASTPDPRTHTLERIMQHNPSARPAWLGQFDEDGLRMYLDRLEQLTGPTPRDRGRWVRPTGTPAATAYECVH